WNQALLLDVRRPLDAALLKQTVEALLAQHDSLRLGFQRAADGRWRQRYHRAAAADELLWVRRVSGRGALEELCEAAQRSLTLKRGSLLRLLLAELPDSGQRLLLVAHHLVVDGVSWRLLLEDLERAYDQLAAGQPVAL